MADLSVYDVYVNGLLEDLARARSGKPLPPNLPNEAKALANQQEFQTTLNAKLANLDPQQGRLENFYHTMSTIAIAEHTAAQVDKPYPECGPNNIKLDDIYDEVSNALGSVSAATASVPGWGTVVSIVSTVLSIATSALGQKHQTRASCATAIALVPSCLKLKDLKFDAWVGEAQNPTANPMVDVHDDNWWGWKHVDKPILSPKPTGTIKVRTPRGDGGTALCEVNTLTINLRNWSHNRNLLFQSQIYWDAPMPGGCEQCADYGMVNPKYRDKWLFDPMTENMESRMSRYLLDVFKQPSAYEAAYKIDHPFLPEARSTNKG